MPLTKKLIGLDDSMWNEIDKVKKVAGIVSHTGFIRQAVQEKIDQITSKNKQQEVKRRH